MARNINIRFQFLGYSASTSAPLGTKFMPINFKNSFEYLLWIRHAVAAEPEFSIRKYDLNQKEFNMRTAPDVIAFARVRIDAYQNVEQRDLNRCNCYVPSCKKHFNSSSCVYVLHTLVHWKNSNFGQRSCNSSHSEKKT